MASPVGPATAGPPALEHPWPHLTHTQLTAIVVVNVTSFFVAYLLLRVWWKPPSKEEIANARKMEIEINAVRKMYSTFVESEEQHEGDAGGVYSKPWTSTFDLVFLILMALGLVGLLSWTAVSAPELFGNHLFWLGQLPKMAVMMCVSLVGGMTCRYFADSVTADGYIMTTRDSKFKVNYTCKLLHFAAYFVPLTVKVNSGVPDSSLTLCWGDWSSLFCVLLMIRPLRERFSLSMIQFNAWDRPEDRPHTLMRVVLGTLLPAMGLILFFRYLFAFTHQEALVYVVVYVAGVGGGLAEPVGITWGRHKYWSRRGCSRKRYLRSWEGSACVWLSATLFTSILYYGFKSSWAFWLVMVVLPPVMTVAEVFAPHALDTPTLMCLCGLVLWISTHASLLWQ